MKQGRTIVFSTCLLNYKEIIIALLFTFNEQDNGKAV
jgi:hypothetical protein